MQCSVPDPLSFEYGCVADPGVFFLPPGTGIWIRYLDPGSGMENKIQSQDPGSRMNIPNLIFENLVSVVAG
jgi:hypothetical protein